MRKSSIVKRITTWYALLMLVVIAVMILFVSIVSQTLVKQELRNDLMSSLQHVKENITVDRGYLDFDEVETFRNQTYLSIYDEYGNIYHGQIPRIFDIETPFIDKKMTEVTYSNEEKILYYDELIEIEGFGNFWLRGVIFYTSLQLSLQRTINLFSFALLIMLILITLGGYYLTKRALKPIDTLRLAANKIGGGKNLQLRLDVKNQQDELGRLSGTFNMMLDRLETAFQHEEQFSHDISHELKTPLAVIMLEVESLKAQTKDQNMIDSLNLIYEKAHQMQSLTSQLLLLARSNNSDIKLDLEVIDLKELIDTMLSSFEYAENSKNIKFEINIEDNTIIKADMNLCIRLLENLLGNSIKYGKDNGTTFIEAHQDTEAMYISISDNGIGIKEKHIDKIFNRLYQADNAKSNNGQSHGLGLAIVKWIVDLHDWEITVDSKYGIGTKFEITIPL